MIVCLGLGSNLGDRLANLRSGVAALAEAVQIEAESRIYETAPLYVTDQPAFLNMAVRAITTRSPRDLLSHLKAIEADLGRVASVRYGPRLIDIDILLFGDVVMETPTLALPHPRLPERRFALAPLADVAADARHPVSGLTVAAMLAALPEGDEVREFPA